ncbi:exonuclease 3'-5' domain-containing protein 2 [Myotis lucifugus]|uniref:exonuclease 3'-5' domain-containing protein 2 n=1 Tax=Myotis lucifugus TaxID=59463 RepID=UPI0006D720BD|nr:exonuclease 3'-5' domain-containing protein 2 [Myotis lucifugus]
MSRHLVALTVTTLLGAAVGAFVLWKGIQRRRNRSSRGAWRRRQQQQQQQQQQHQLQQHQHQQQQQQQQQQAPSRTELPPPEVDQLPSSAPRASWEERILEAKVVTVSQEAEWDQVEPLLRSGLEDIPVLGIDCEWQVDFP